MSAAGPCCGLCSCTVWHDRVTASTCAPPVQSAMDARLSPSGIVRPMTSKASVEERELAKVDGPDAMAAACHLTATWVIFMTTRAKAT